MEEYKKFLQKINGNNNTDDNLNVSIANNINRKFEGYFFKIFLKLLIYYRSTFSPRFPLKQLRMERSHDSLINKLKDLTQIVKEIPENVKSFDIIPLNNIQSNKDKNNECFDDLLKKNNSNSIQQSTSSISSILKNFPTLNAFSGPTTNDSIHFPSSLFNSNPFRFNAAPSPR